MKFCQPHWDKLRAAIDARGLTPFVPAGGEEAARRMQAELQAGEVRRENFDPLMGAHWAIAGNAIQHPMLTRDGALGLIGGEHCPICFLNDGAIATGHADLTFDNWIERAADDALAHARKLGLVGGA